MPGRTGRDGATPLTRAQWDVAGAVLRENFDPTKVKSAKTWRMQHQHIVMIVLY